MTATTLLFVLLILVCPLLMVFMHRGGRGHGGPAHGEAAADDRADSLDELRRRRTEIDAEISAREGR